MAHPLCGVVALVARGQTATYVGCLVLAERYVLVQPAEEWRRTVEMIACAGLDKEESAVAQIVEVVVQMASGDAQTVGYLLRRVAAVVGKEEYEVKLATVFVHSHNIKIKSPTPQPLPSREGSNM